VLVKTSSSEFGTTLYVLDDDPRGDALITSGGDFNPTSRRLWRRLCEREQWTTIVDVGANYGEMILTFPLPPAARVVAFEPAPRVVTCLRRSVDEAHAAVEVIEQAVGSKAGQTVLFEDLHWSGSTTATPSFALADSRKHSVEMIRLDDFFRTRGIGPGEKVLIKIDVEGGERQVLEGLLSTLRAVEQVLIQSEILHTPEDDLKWVIGTFFLHLVAIPDLTLVPVATLGDYSRLMETGRFYPQDAVLATSLLDMPETGTPPRLKRRADPVDRVRSPH